MSAEAASRRFRGLAAFDPSDYEVGPRVGCLRELLNRPDEYSQRLVEELSFLPSGGQQWVRQLQIKIPPDASDLPSAGRWIVSLGAFTRARLPDIEVFDERGKRLNLVTRRQHGEALTRVVAGSFLPKELLGANLNDGLRDLLDLFRKDLFDFFTSFQRVDPGENESKRPSDKLVVAYGGILDKCELPPKKKIERLNAFINAFIPWGLATHYLCWVDARPGQVVNLRVSYTLQDPRQHSAGQALAERWLALKKGLNLRGGDDSRKQRADWYRQFGLAPINYSFKIPRKPGAPNSYYLILKPPPSTEVTYLDWEVGHSFGGEMVAGDVKCAFPAVHIHNTEQDERLLKGVSNDFVKIRAFLRCAPQRHKQILGAVALNMAIVFLIARGSLPGNLGEPLQGLIIAAPSIVIGFITQQQRHYYSQVIRRQRGLLWSYLVVSVAFIVAIAFSEHNDSLHLHGVGTVAAWALAATSGSVFGWQWFLGRSYVHIVTSRTKKKARWSGRPWWEIYADATREMGSKVIKLAFLGLAVGIVGMCFFTFVVHSNGGRSEQPKRRTEAQRYEAALEKAHTLEGEAAAGKPRRKVHDKPKASAPRHK